MQMVDASSWGARVLGRVGTGVGASVRLARKELTMSLMFHFNDPCPKCGKPSMYAVIDRHPTKSDIAIHKLQCAQCGPLKTQALPLKPASRRRDSQHRTHAN
jgi:hypothetical protein